MSWLPKVAAPAEPAADPVGCPECGRTFSNRSAWLCAHDDGACLPQSVFESVLLRQVDGVWCLAGSDIAAL